MTVKYVLMHKNIPVALLDMDDNTGYILKVSIREKGIAVKFFSDYEKAKEWMFY